MGIKIIKPTTNGQRNASRSDHFSVRAQKPTVKSLLLKSKKVTGRANGTISIRHRGGGTRSKYRQIDFSGTEKLGVVGKITTIEYDPKRTAHIALVVYKDGDKRYVIAHKGAKIGDEVLTDVKAKARDGNRMQIKNIPVGYSLFNIELVAGKGGTAVRSAGKNAILVSLDGAKAQIQLPSGEIRFVEKTNFATIGTVSNEENSQVRVGKAGRTRHKGRRPEVRGKAMNPCDHPHGGGEGGSSVGMKYPKTPWGSHALGVKTRKNKLADKLIVKSRHRAKKK